MRRETKRKQSEKDEGESEKEGENAWRRRRLEGLRIDNFRGKNFLFILMAQKFLQKRIQKLIEIFYFFILALVRRWRHCKI